MRKRLFISLPLTASARKKLDSLMRTITLPKTCRLVDEELWHITALFLGYMEDEHMPAILESLEEVARQYEQFTIRLNEVCMMPSNRPRMMWITGDAESSERVYALEQLLVAALLKRGIPFELPTRSPHVGKPFTAHITLARCGRVEEVFTPIPTNIQFNAQELTLIESRLLGGRPDYVPFAHFPLEGAL